MCYRECPMRQVFGFFGAGLFPMMGLAGATLLLLAVFGCDSASRPRGSSLDGALTAVTDLDGRPIDPLSDTDKTKAAVFIFVSTECPISNQYMPEIGRLHQKFGDKGVSFWLVNPNPDESAKSIRDHMTKFSYPCPVLLDHSKVLARKANVQVTPEAAVFRPGAGLAYHGRINNRYVEFGKTRPAATQHDLENVLEAVLAGSTVKMAPRPAVGCRIAGL